MHPASPSLHTRDVDGRLHYPAHHIEQEGAMRRTAIVLVAVLALGLLGCSGKYKPGGQGGAASAAQTGPTGATGGVPADCEDQTGAPATIKMVNFAFVPSCLKVSASQSLTFVNEDQSAHRFILEDGYIDQVIDAGKTVKVKSLSDIPPGTYAFACGFHPPMTGTLIVE
jgi:plastocyanin